jgi:fumarate reductase subunit D
MAAYYGGRSLTMARSHKPIVWGLFAAGGTVAAFVLPALILLSGAGVALGLLPESSLEYENLRGVLTHPLTRLVLFGVLFLILWHAAHRLRITAHDLGIRADTLVATVFYAIAGLGSVLLAIALISLA